MNKNNILLLIIIFSVDQIFAKRIIRKDYNSNTTTLVNEQFELVSLDELQLQNADIKVQKCLENYYCKVKPFEHSSKFPHDVYFKQPYILYIPQGKVQRDLGLIYYQDKIIKDLFRGGEVEKDFLKSPWLKSVTYNGRVAVIAQFGAENYFHWTTEVLARLALLEIEGVEYDKLYVSILQSFMKALLVDIWGIDESKIIPAINNMNLIQADMLIVPSVVYNLMVTLPVAGTQQSGHYVHPVLIKYVREKILFNLKQKINIDNYNFSKKVFISRKDSIRKILNEDEVFKLFEAKGFKRYVLSQMSAIEQILLFHNAELIVGEHGAGLTNILYCQPNTKVIEIFHILIPGDYWWLASVCGLDYTAIKTVPIDADLFVGPNASQFFSRGHFAQVNISLDEIKKTIEKLL